MGISSTSEILSKMSQFKSQKKYLVNEKGNIDKTNHDFLISIDDQKIISVKHNSTDPMFIWACDLVNKEKIDLGNKDKKKIDYIINKYISMSINSNLIEELKKIINKNYINEKEIKHDLMISSPEEHRFVRPIQKYQNTILHLFSRNRIFLIISNEDRKKYIEISQKNGKELDIPINREFECWEDNIYGVITGPILCDYDKKVFLACVKLWHENDCIGSGLITNLSKIWRTIGNKSRLGIKNIETLKRSLDRLHKVSLTIKSKENKNFWGGGIVDSVIYKEFSNTKNHEVIVKFNEYMLQTYLDGAYATIHYDLYCTLTPSEQSLYEFLMSHKDLKRKMHFKNFITPLGISESVELRRIKSNIKSAINELLKKEILAEGSIDSQGFVHTLVNQKHLLKSSES